MNREARASQGYRAANQLSRPQWTSGSPRRRHLSSASDLDFQVFLFLNVRPRLLVAQTVKNPPAMQERQVPSQGLAWSPGGGNDNPLQYSCLENSTDRGAWQATVHGVKKSWTWLQQHSPAYHLRILWTCRFWLVWDKMGLKPAFLTWWCCLLLWVTI